MEKAKGGRPSKTASPGSAVIGTLKDLGVSDKQSSQWQKLAGIPRESDGDCLVIPMPQRHHGDVRLFSCEFNADWSARRPAQAVACSRPIVVPFDRFCQ